MFNSDSEPEPEIKRLCFALSEHGLKEFLLSESFQGILLNHDKFDVLWRNIQRRVIDESPVAVLIPEYTGDAEETMERFLNTIYLSKDRRLPSFLDEILLNLSKENDLRPIMNKIRVLLKQMKIKDNRIKQMMAFKQLEARDSLQTAEYGSSNWHQQSYSKYQVFVLAYLTQKEMEQLENDEIFGHHSPGVTAKYRYETNVSQLATLPVSSIIPSRDRDPKTMMKDIETQISKMIGDGLLEYEHSATHPSFKGWQFEDFHVTPTGKYFIQSFFGGLASTLREKKKYNELIEEAQVSSELKNFLKGLYGKLKAEAQEEIARTLLSKVKEYGVPLLVILIKMASANSETANVAQM